jgi:predicted metalloenzyme YecM
MTLINECLEANGIGRSELAMCDHLAYRVETMERYEVLKKRLSQVALLVGETIVAERPIAVFELYEYLRAGEWTIPYIELPAPKVTSSYPEGLEHAEFVVIGSLDVFRERHPEIQWIDKTQGRPFNPELGLKNNGQSLKFHEQPIGSVVRTEQRLQPHE